MKKILMFGYSIISYLIAFGALLYWIASVSNLIPEISIDQPATASFTYALFKNIGLVLLFGLQHSIMARKSFKQLFAKYFPIHVERSTFVLASGLLLILLVKEWEPMGGMIWQVTEYSVLYYILYVLFFVGWSILFISSFLINHFDLFGLRQTYLELTGKPYTNLQFKIIWFYKYVRHPLYFGGIVGLWATPTMSVTHLVFAIGLTSYFVVGTLFEEKDLKSAFGTTYKNYQAKTPMLIPFTKMKRFTKITVLVLLLGFQAKFSYGQEVLNTQYLLQVENEPSTIVSELQHKVATFNVSQQAFYDNTENARYQISFSTKEGKINTVYTNNSKIISSIETYKNIKLPLEISRAILQKYPDWTIAKNKYSVVYRSWENVQRIYTIQIALKKKKKLLKYRWIDHSSILALH